MTALMKGPVRLADLAKRLNLSLTTVSRALNGYEDVSEATRTRVRAVADKMGYHVNRQARGLALNKNHLVTLVINDDDRRVRPYQSITFEFIAGARDFFGTTSYDMLMLPRNSRSKDGGSLGDYCASRGIAGMIIIGLRTDDPAINELEEDGIPAVAFDYPLRGTRTTFVESDNKKGCRLAVDLLVSQGHRDVVFLNGHKHAAVSVVRGDGYREAMAANRLEYRSSMVINANFTERGGYEAIDRLLARNVDFTAIFAASDLMALGAVKRLLERGIRVPEDVAVIGFDDMFFTEYSQPRLTTIRQRFFDLGHAAAEELHRILEEPGHTPTRRTVDVELVLRESV